MSVQRFELEHHQAYTTSEMYPDSNGEWVTYSDYKTLEDAYHSKEEEIKELTARTLMLVAKLNVIQRKLKI